MRKAFLPERILRIQNTVIEKVDKFKYLGHNIHVDKSDYFLETQIGAAYGAFNKNKHVLLDRRVNVRARMLLLTAMVRSRLTYSVQAWRLSNAQIQKLAVVWNRMLRRMVRGHSDPDGGKSGT